MLESVAKIVHPLSICQNQIAHPIFSTKSMYALPSDSHIKPDGNLCIFNLSSGIFREFLVIQLSVWLM